MSVILLCKMAEDDGLIFAVFIQNLFLKLWTGESEIVFHTAKPENQIIAIVHSYWLKKQQTRANNNVS